MRVFRVYGAISPRSSAESISAGSRAVADGPNATAFGFNAVAAGPGSMTAIRKGSYYIKQDGQTYAFTVTKAIEKTILVYRKDAEQKLSLVKMKDIKDDGTWEESTPLEYTDTPEADAKEITG